MTVLKRYFYAISDLSVGGRYNLALSSSTAILSSFGSKIRKMNQFNSMISSFYRCKCNGHASECYSVDSTSERCKCEHNTNGTDCERCNDLYNDAPWGVANAYDAHECRGE